MQDEFERVGKRLFVERLVGASFGNMSVRMDNGFSITRNGSYLDCPDSRVFVPMSGEVPPGASSEYRVHRAVYHATDCKAIIHAHPPYAIACSLRYDQIVPVDSEGLMFTPLIPVVDGACGSEELASRVACSLAAHSIVVARGHGTFAAGISLDAAYLLTSAAEHSCQILYLAGTTRTR